MLKELSKIFSLLLAIIFSTTGYLASLTITALVASEVMPSQLFVGVPNAITVGGALIGAKMIGYLSSKISMLTSLIGAYLVGGVGGFLLFQSILYDSSILILLGALILGVGQAATLQTRYFASFIVHKKYKNIALSTAVWFSAFGSVFGPTAVGLFSPFFLDIYNSDLIVGYILAFTGMISAGTVLFIFTDRKSGLREKNKIKTKNEKIKRVSGEINLSMILVINHAIMVLIMSATPLHLRDIGESIGAVGNIISVHTLGMFFFAPIIGKIVDVIGVQKTALIGSLLILLSCILTLFYTSIFFLGLGLFFLGLGWNFTFISVSSAISFFSTKYSSDLNIRSDMYVFAGSAFTHLILGFSYFNLGYRTIASLGILITLWLVFKTQRLDQSIEAS